MTVVLLDPRRPFAVPIEAVALLAGPVEVADNVPGEVRAVLREAPGAPVLVALAPEEPGGGLHPRAAARVSAGAAVLRARPMPGDALLDAVGLMDRLRAHGHWESEQTHQSLRRYLLEEAYELLDAVHTDDRAELREELGDLLLQVLFHARIAADHPDDPFTVDEVAAALTRKLRNRTPLDYGQPGAPADAAEQNRRWNERKAREKGRASALDGIAMAQPALALAEQVLGRASEAGLPPDLVPLRLQAVHLDPGGEAEHDLRQAVLEFTRRFRAAEAAVPAQARQTPEAWRKAWGAPAGNGSVTVGS